MGGTVLGNALLWLAARAASWGVKRIETLVIGREQEAAWEEEGLAARRRARQDVQWAQGVLAWRGRSMTRREWDVYQAFITERERAARGE